MGRVRVSRELPGGRMGEAEALWLEPARWASFVDGFGHVVRREGGWPAVGGRLVWQSPPGGRGRVVERVVAHGRCVVHACGVEAAGPRGGQTVRWAAREGGAEMAVELEYELKFPRFGGALDELLFARRRVRERLTRTLARFAIELAADRELQA